MFVTPVKNLYRGKRLFDVCVAMVALALLLPLLVLTAALVRFKLGSPVLFRQHRPGKAGQSFVLLKFRTMTEARRSDGSLLDDAERVTGLGGWLRSSSLDELPELWNVVRGEMSLVGPRPLLDRYLNRYTPEQARRHEVRPGLTGLAQVSGRNALSWEEKFQLDVWYVDNCSFLLDMKILWLTVWQVVIRRGINQPGHVTAEEFLGGHQSGVA
jgi:lipopolysaccharide/colanic/teichoic acid biosynthesis glycosyltransferase